MCRGAEFSSKHYFELLLAKRFDEAENYRQSFIPRKVYKFFRLDDDTVGDAAEQQRMHDRNQQRFNALWNNCLWASRAYLFNDPYEFQCMYLDEERLRAANWPEHWISLYKRLMAATANQWGVICFSEVEPEANMPMWAYYSNNSRGFCVEFDVLNAKLLHEVFYEPDRVPIARIFTEFTAEAIADGSGKGDAHTEGNMELYSTIFAQRFFMKHESWRHEHEYRALVPLEPGKDGANVSIESAGLKVTRIITGLACSDLHKGILNNISNELGCGDAYHVEMSDTSFISIVRR